MSITQFEVFCMNNLLFCKHFNTDSLLYVNTALDYVIDWLYLLTCASRTPDFERYYCLDFVTIRIHVTLTSIYG